MSTEIDIKKLEEEFNLTPENAQIEAKKQISLMRDAVKKAEEDIESLTPDQILRNNIDRANGFLDVAEKMLSGGSFSANLIEACASLISQITAATNVLMAAEFNEQTFSIKERSLDLKELEIKLKNEKSDEKGVTNNTTNNNILVTDRESLLKMIFSKDEGEIIDITENQLKLEEN